MACKEKDAVLGLQVVHCHTPILFFSLTNRENLSMGAKISFMICCLSFVFWTVLVILLSLYREA